VYLHPVKKHLQTTGLISIALLYCLSIGLYSGMAFTGNAAIAKQCDAADESYGSSISAKSFQHTVQTENSITVCNHSNPVTVKNTHKEFSAVNTVTEKVLVHSFSQYSFYAHKLLIRLQNTNLIFPFQYFW
jgi:lipid-binding SYLF domain-containing protein